MSIAPLQPPQIRAARGLLGWSMSDLASAAGVSISTVKRMEIDGPQLVSNEIYATVQAAMEAAGVQFLDDEGEGWGLWLQPR